MKHPIPQQTWFPQQCIPVRSRQDRVLDRMLTRADKKTSYLHSVRPLQWRDTPGTVTLFDAWQDRTIVLMAEPVNRGMQIRAFDLDEADSKRLRPWNIDAGVVLQPSWRYEVWGYQDDLVVLAGDFVLDIHDEGYGPGELRSIESRINPSQALAETMAKIERARQEHPYPVSGA